MKTLIKNGQVYMNRHFEKKDLLLDDRKIAVIGDFLEPEDADTAVYDAENRPFLCKGRHHILALLYLDGY